MRKQLAFLSACVCVISTLATANADDMSGFRIFQTDFQNENIVHFGLDDSKTIALTFDDGPGDGTAKVLDLLKKHHIHATFFALGRQLKQFPEIAKRIVSEGHILANHSYSHAFLGAGKYKEHPELLDAEIRDTHTEIKKYIEPGQKLFFRAPMGGWQPSNAMNLNKDPELRRYVGPICWDAGRRVEWNKKEFTNSADWQCAISKYFKMPAARCMEGYLFKIREIGGGVVLMHDIYSQTADMVEMMLPILIKEGYKFATLSELPEFDRYAFGNGSNVPRKTVPNSLNSPFVGRCGALPRPGYTHLEPPTI